MEVHRELPKVIQREVILLKGLFPQLEGEALTLKFSEYLNTTTHMILLSGCLMLGMYLWDLVIDPIGAEHTLRYRVAITCLLITTALASKTPRLRRRLKFALLCTTALLSVVALFVIYMQLKDGFVYGVAGFVYVQIATLFCLMCLPVTWAALMHVAAALTPHLLAAGLGLDRFPHLLYAITVWPATLMAIGAQVFLERDFAVRLELRTSLRTLATVDPLTGASNRRAFWDAAPRLVARAARLERPVAALVIDLDHFKKINDAHGHDIGDTVLVAVSACIKHEIRQEELFCRWGGEEFVVLVDEAQRDAGLNLANRLIAALRDLRIPLPDGSILSLTVSIGMAHSQDGNVQALIKSADAALYQAKAAGRDRVQVA